MSRRAHVLRTDDIAGIPTQRSLSAVLIYCDVSTGAAFGNTPTPVLTVPFNVVRSYQRVFLSTTVTGIHTTEGNARIRLSDGLNGTEAADATIAGQGLPGPAGHPVCLTGTIDLTVGDHDLVVTLQAPDGTGEFHRASMQVIVGQIVDQPGCLFTGVGS